MIIMPHPSLYLHSSHLIDVDPSLSSPHHTPPLPTPTPHPPPPQKKEKKKKKKKERKTIFFYDLMGYKKTHTTDINVTWATGT